MNGKRQMEPNEDKERLIPHGGKWFTQEEWDAMEEARIAHGKGRHGKPPRNKANEYEDGWRRRRETR